MATTIPVITIDGPSGVGKGTLCKALTKVLQWRYLDSGAIYRTLAFLVLYHSVDINSKKDMIALAMYLNINFVITDDSVIVMLENQDITYKIRTAEIANLASIIASFPYIRTALLTYQRSFRKYPGLIAEGRDMGTIVFPDALIKIFLDASLEERAHRRLLQSQKEYFSANTRECLSAMKDRDNRDRNRSIAPMIPAEDALIIDLTNLSIEQSLKQVLQYINKKMLLI